MLLELLGAIGSVLERQRAIEAIVLIFSLYFLRAWANGASTDRERDMHGRVVIITGCLTPIGAAVMDELARRGAQLIALVPSIEDPIIQELIPAMRTAANNELIFAEECDLGSAASIQAFCKRFTQLQPSVDGQSRPEPSRLDAVITMHEYLPMIPDSVMTLPSGPGVPSAAAADQLRASAATFLLTTLIIPSLLRAPSDRDIRFINVTNPLYAAAIPTFDPASPFPRPGSKSSSASEGTRSLRAIILARHAQRLFDALSKAGEKSESTGPLPDLGDLSNARGLYEGSNMLSVVVSPGYTSQYVRQMVKLSFAGKSVRSFVARSLLSVILTPILLILTKSTHNAAQSILHALFLPHPMKLASSSLEPTPSTHDQSIPSNSTLKLDSIRALRGGQLYRDLNPVVLPAGAEDALVGREDIGRAVWEFFEAQVKEWETEEKALLEEAARLEKEKSA